MSDELILDVSFDNQTVTDATENWTLSGTPNVTYEQISGGSGYSLVTGKLGTPPILVAVDQEAIYNEYTIDFNLYVKPSYTDAGWFSFFNLDTGVNYTGDYEASVSNGLKIRLAVGGGSPEVTIDSPTGRWIHITIISEYDSDTGAYTAYLYVDSVLRTYKQGTRLNGSPFAIGEKLVLFNRGGSNFHLPNTPGLAMDNLTVIAGIHVPNQTPAISLPNLSRVFNNFCTWLKGQLSTVALTGSYNDLSDKPTISTVNDGTLTIQKNGTNVATFTANQSTAATANITVPTAVSELTNDSGYLTSSSNLDASKLTSGTVDIARLPQGALERLVKVANEAARYALTIADVQLGDTVQQLDTGIMYVVTDTDHLDSAAGYTEYTAGTAASVPWSGVTGKPTFAAVATSGAYSDLTGTPTIPTVNDATLTIQQNGVNVQTFTANASANATANITVPTKTSDLTNDSGFITSDDTKIPLSGSNAISGSLIPATTNAYDLGGSSYRWNNAYATTFNGNVVGRQNLTLQSNSGLARIFLRNDEDSSFPNSVNIYSTVDNVEYGVFLVGSSFFPTINGEMNFGYSQRRWKDCYTNAINGLNPGALSLPSMAFIALDTTNFDATSTTIGTFTPTVDGWAILSMSQKNKHFGIWILSGGYRVTFNSVYNNGDYFVFALIPVRANIAMTVYCTADDIDSTRKIDWLRLFPCQGNV